MKVNLLYYYLSNFRSFSYMINFEKYNVLSTLYLIRRLDSSLFLVSCDLTIVSLNSSTLTRRMSHVEYDLLNTPPKLSNHPQFWWGSPWLVFSLLFCVLCIKMCLWVFFFFLFLAIALSVYFWSTSLTVIMVLFAPLIIFLEFNSLRSFIQPLMDK